MKDDLNADAVKRTLGERLLRGLAGLRCTADRPSGRGSDAAGAFYLAALPGGAALVLTGSFFGPQLVEELLRFGFMALAGMLIAGTFVLSCAFHRS